MPDSDFDSRIGPPADLPSARRDPPAKAPPGEAAGPADALATALYGTLRDMADKLLSREAGSLAVDATDIVHECYLRLARIDEFRALERADFLALAATLIRNILVDLARRRRAAKRGADWRRTTLSGLSFGGDGEVDLIELDDALRRLAVMDERQHRIVELRFFAGLSGDEIANLLCISRRTAVKEWTMARAWLRRDLGP